MTVKLKDKYVSIDANSKFNWLRSAALGSSDGIISIAGLVIGLAESGQPKEVILTAGLAGVIAGFVSMGSGEYVSVHTMRDAEEAILNKERVDLVNQPQKELDDLVSAYEQEGIQPSVAKDVARELTKVNALEAHAEAEFHIDSKHLINPWLSVLASTVSFIVGASIPLIAILLSPTNIAMPVTFCSVILALVITGSLTGKASGAKVLKSTLRVVIGGIIAMVAARLVGSFFNN